MRRIDLIAIIACCIGLGFGAGLAIGERHPINPTRLDVVCKRLDMPACMDVAENTYPSATDMRLRIEPKP